MDDLFALDVKILRATFRRNMYPDSGSGRGQPSRSTQVPLFRTQVHLVIYHYGQVPLDPVLWQLSRCTAEDG